MAALNQDLGEFLDSHTVGGLATSSSDGRPRQSAG